MDTPMIKQYKEIKSKYPEHIVFFRLGDFYEMFFEDAHIGSKELEIALTSRDPENKTPMAGVPYHAADQYIAKLVKKGYKVVICEQMEDPKKTKTIVKRDVVKIVTPGTVTDLNSLEEKKNNFLCCIYKHEDEFGLAFIDLMTGKFFATELKSFPSYQDLLNELVKFDPIECLVNDEVMQDIILKKRLTELNLYLTLKPRSYFDEHKARDLISSKFEKKKVQELVFKEKALRASAACLSYLNETQKTSLHHIDDINIYECENYMMIDLSCRKNLELTESLKDGRRQGTLLWVLDYTTTSMGARLLRNWIEQPLVNIMEIKERQDSVEELFENFFICDDLKQQLKDIYDLERLTGKLVCGNINARDFIAIKNTIARLPGIKNILSQCKSKLLNNIFKQIDILDDIYTLLDKSIDDQPSLSVKDGGIIKQGFNKEIDRLKEASKKGKLWIAELETKEKERTGIKSLKIGFNKVFGYYIEVTKSNLSMVPSDYIRKQTLANAERYITEELKRLEDSILNAEQKLKELEYDVFCKVRDELISHIPRLKQSARLIAIVDVLLSLAEASSKKNYVKPEITLNDEINIIDGRHPVVEHAQKNEMFIPNDTHINCRDSMISIITGPNMAGKSTYMRQVALIVLMAHIGCFVPAKKAEICLVDKIFTRIGASDNLASGQSTFMVEMTEVAYILKNSTSKSLLILDEVGRGTSTFDGLSIAWAVIEYIQKKIKAKTLFATHYHELTVLRDLQGVKNYKITVKEKGEDIIFLRKVVNGEADKSYGIQVAKLAGLPNSILNRAKEILKGLESEQNIIQPSPSKEESAATKDVKDQDAQMDIYSINEKEIISKIKSLDINTLTPLEALNLLYRFQSQLK